MKSDRQRTAALVNINAQVAEDEASAAYLEQAKYMAVSQGETAANMGYLKAGADVAGGLFKMLTGFGGGSLSSPSVGDPTRLGSMY